jgi:stress-induced morphogen
MSIQSEIQRKLASALEPVHLEIENESHRHSVAPGSETHFKVIVVSEQFTGQTLLSRHRLVYELLSDELRTGVHALSVQAHTPAEWKRAAEHRSPPCLGGSGK